MPCAIHPAATRAAFICDRPYCARCVAEIHGAVASLDGHVTPRDCFVWYTGSQTGWEPITGTGCAHYVAHQLNITVGSASARCLAGFSHRVPDVIVGRQEVTGGLAAVELNDIWVSPTRNHTGLVSKIDPPAPTSPGNAPAPPTIWITHASSGQHRLATDRFDVYFHSGGDFFR
jgi:hypothetical protein